MTGLIMALVSCLLGPQQAEECMPIMNQIVEEEERIEKEEMLPNIKHLGYAEDSYVQDIVKYAYGLGGIDFVILLECENGRYALDGVGDNGHSHGLCMVNDRWHTLPNGFYDDYKIQVDYCYELYVNHTKFYGPNRLIHGQKCKDYVLNRFEINDIKSN